MWRTRNAVLRGNVRRHDVVLLTRLLLEDIFALKVRFETDLAGVQRCEVDLIAQLEYAHGAVKRGLVLAEGARLGRVNDATLDPQRLQPAIIKVRRIFLHDLECLPEGVLHADAHSII